MFELAHPILFLLFIACYLGSEWIRALRVLFGVLSRERTKPVQKLLGQIYGRKRSEKVGLSLLI